MSKVQKGKKGCQFVLKRGPKAGKKCGKGCRGDFCKNHNPSRLQYKKKYNDHAVENNKEMIIKRKLKEIRKGEREFPNLFIIDIKIRSLRDKITLLRREYYGHKQCIDPDFICPIKKSYLDYIESNVYVEEIREVFDDLHPLDQKKYGSFEKYFMSKKKNELDDPVRINPVHCNLKPRQAEKNIKIIVSKFEELKKRVCLLQYYRDELDKIQGDE